ncbi:MAG TPA: hypothetical protein VF767_07575 [Bryobacteraceae bacterium]
MTNTRERLHQLVDALPEGTLQAAEAALRRGAQASRGHVEHVGMWVADLDTPQHIAAIAACLHSLPVKA